ncbi:MULTISPECIES: hypothetical protein [unclassified Pseudomonas]|uniref:hypothetical protein n=1 Tax=unclassified Pseudomonas TaxID=196821 RepID=UPI00244ABDBC|nr:MULTISPECIES: hypothetical protein [unclassified Pseudomonas]MDH0303985.1 hypothetical protein [Pseudomonas sp. GD04091]MDH1986166.1 hypothetical protein [Pseudomonas sp. GD03689]
MSQESISPLTLIAVFAGVIEASALASLPFLSDDSQTIYTWFLVVFPFFLTVLFFLTLNFNTGSLFAPDKHEPCSSPAPTAAPHATPNSTAQEAHEAPAAAAEQPAEQDGNIFIAISGPDSRKMIENHILRMIEKRHTTAQRWTLYNLETRTCIHLSAAPMGDDVEVPFASTRIP